MKKFKIHFYGFRYYFLVFTSLFITYLLLSILVVNNNHSIFLPILFTAFTVLNFSLGTYEYNRISCLHTSIIVNRKPFFLSSLIFGLLNIVFLILLFVGYALLLNQIHNINIDFVSNLEFYLLVISIFSFSYILGSLYGLWLAKCYRFNIAIVIIIIITLLIFNITFDIIFDFVGKLIYLEFDKTRMISGILIASTIIITYLNKILYQRKTNH